MRRGKQEKAYSTLRQATTWLVNTLGKELSDAPPFELCIWGDELHSNFNVASGDSKGDSR